MEEVSALTLPVCGSNNMIRRSNCCFPTDLEKYQTNQNCFYCMLKAVIESNFENILSSFPDALWLV